MLEFLITCIIKGDGKYASIAAASILAKTYRDEYMEKLHQEFPEYGWNRNKGYPTQEHRKALLEFGPHPITGALSDCLTIRWSWTFLKHVQFVIKQ